MYIEVMVKRKQDKDKAIIQNMEISCQRSIIKKDIEGKDNGNNIWKHLFLNGRQWTSEWNTQTETTQQQQSVLVVCFSLFSIWLTDIVI